MRQLTKEAEVLKAAILSSQAQLWPTATGNLSYDLSGTNASHLDRETTFGVTVSIPLFHGGRNVEGVLASNAEYRGAVEAARSARDQRIADLGDRWSAFRDAWEFVETVTQGQVLAWMSATERAALLDAARAQGGQTLARWEVAYKAAPLLAPLDGTVIVRAVEPGQTLTTADPVVVIADRLIVKAQVDETDIGAIAVGQSASISLDAFPDQVVPAHVDHIAYEAKTVNDVTVYEVDVLPKQVPGFMRSGMTATVTFTTAATSGVLALPIEAVQRDQTGATVLIPAENTWQRPARRNVTTGLTDGKWIEIISGFQEGDAVLVPALRAPRTSKTQRRNTPLSPFGGGGRTR